MNKKNKNKNKKLNSPSSVIILILSILLFINVLAFTIRLSDSLTSGYTYEYSDLLRSAEELDFPELTDGILRNEARGRVPQQDTSDLKHLAEYYDAAFFSYAGENDMSSKMNEARSAIVSDKVLNIADELCVVLETASDKTDTTGD